MESISRKNTKEKYAPSKYIHEEQDGAEGLDNDLYNASLNVIDYALVSIQKNNIENIKIALDTPLRTFQEYIEKYNLKTKNAVIKNSQKSAIKEYNKLVKEFNKQMPGMIGLVAQNKSELIVEALQRYGRLFYEIIHAEKVQ